MRTAEVEVNVFHYCAAMSVCTKASKWFSALDCFEEYLSSPSAVDVPLVNSKLKALANCGWDAALEGLHAVQAAGKMGIEVDTVSFNASMGGADWQHALAFPQIMQQEDVAASVVTFNCSMVAQGPEHWPWALQILSGMHQHRLSNDVTLTAILGTLQNNQEMTLWCMALGMLEDGRFFFPGKEAHARAHMKGRWFATHLPSLVSSLVVLIVGLLTVFHSLRDIQTSIQPIGTLRQTVNLVQESNKIREEQGQQENKEKEGGELREIEGAENQSSLEVKPKAPLEHLQSSQRFRQLIWSAEEAIGGLPQACSNHQGRGRIEKLTNGVAHSDMICQPEMDGHRDEGKDGILGAGSLACYSLPSAGRSMHYLCQGKNWLGQSTVKREGLAWGLSFSALCKWSQGVSVPLPFYIEGNKGNKELMDFTPLREKKPCDQWIEETTFIFRPREDVGRNPWHAHEEFLTLFASVAALDLQEYRMLINRPSRDPQKLYPPYELHRTLFSPTKLWHSDDFRGTVCFSRVVIPLPPERAPHTKKPLPNCVLNPWILGYRMHLASTYGLTDLWHHGTASPLSVLLISRKGSFKRQISNEQELLVALRAETVSARALVMDQTSSLTEQLKAVAASQLLIGAHGAALFWLIVLPLCGAVFEFGTGADHHYQMLASYVGIRHRYVGPGFSHGSPRIVADVKATIHQLKKERVQLQQCSVDLPQ
eukprot:symbB.v1.2.021970.t1/scaffold1899.1/size238565/6